MADKHKPEADRTKGLGQGAKDIQSSLDALKDRILSNPLKASYKAWASNDPDEKSLGEDATIEFWRNGAKTYKCNICGSRFQDIKDVKAHLEAGACREKSEANMLRQLADLASGLSLGKGGQNEGVLRPTGYELARQAARYRLRLVGHNIIIKLFDGSLAGSSQTSWSFYEVVLFETDEELMELLVFESQGARVVLSLDSQTRLNEIEAFAEMSKYGKAYGEMAVSVTFIDPYNNEAFATAQPRRLASWWSRYREREAETK